MFFKKVNFYCALVTIIHFKLYFDRMTDDFTSNRAYGEGHGGQKNNWEEEKNHSFKKQSVEMKNQEIKKLCSKYKKRK